MSKLSTINKRIKEMQQAIKALEEEKQKEEKHAKLQALFQRVTNQEKVVNALISRLDYEKHVLNLRKIDVMDHVEKEFLHK